jgi:hypothetical protein
MSKPRDVYFDDDATAPVPVVHPPDRYFDDPVERDDDRNMAEMLFAVCALISKGSKKTLPVRMAALEIVAGYERRTYRAIASELGVTHGAIQAAETAIRRKLGLAKCKR